MIIMLVMQASVPVTYAISEVEQACQDKKPDYDSLLKQWNDSKVKDQNAYQKAFDAAQLGHHDYEGCLFDFAERTVLKGTKSTNVMDANLLNTGGIPVFSTLVDWMAPDQACLSSDDLKKIIQQTDPSKMLDPVLSEYSAYRNFLTTVGNDFDANGVLSSDQNQSLTLMDTLLAKQNNSDTLMRERKLEIQSSIMVIDLMFTSLKELRLNFVMHVRFQCMLKFLQNYRKALEDMRLVVGSLPSLLQDASMVK